MVITHHPIIVLILGDWSSLYECFLLIPTTSTAESTTDRSAYSVVVFPQAQLVGTQEDW